MANNRVALRDLQARLAQRLEQARGQATVAGWLAVEVFGQGYLLPLAQAGEIFPFTLPMKVPYTQDWFAGVVNLRGGVYGVVDLRRFLLGSSAAARTELSRNQSRYVAFNSALELNCVLMVDGLAGLRNPQSFVHEQAANEGGAEYLGPQLVDEQGRLWQEIDMQKLATDEQFLSVSASQLALH
jgi:twitching motility protein PilI